MADTSEDKRLKEDRLQGRRDRLVAEVRIWDLLNELGVSGNEAKGKIHCIFPGHDEKTPSMKVYPETDSVYCFGCSGSGDVVEVARRCASDGKAWPLDRAVEWLEHRFDIAPLPEIVTFAERIKSKLKTWREVEAKPDSPDPRMLAAKLSDQIAEALVGVNPNIKVALLPFEDYLWSEFEQPGVDYTIWYSWASKFITGYYNRVIAEMAEFLASPEFVAGEAEAKLEAGLLADDHFASEKAGSP